MEVKEERAFIGRFKTKEDLLGALTDLCKKENIRLGVFSVIGALKCVKLGYYDQDAKKYTGCVEINKKLEITSCTGNISLKDSEIFVHAHITVADREGNCYGGHLMPGSIIFASEYYVKELTGASLERVDDPETGLSLWKQHKE